MKDFNKPKEKKRRFYPEYEVRKMILDNKAKQDAEKFCHLNNLPYLKTTTATEFIEEHSKFIKATLAKAKSPAFKAVLREVIEPPDNELQRLKTKVEEIFDPDK